MSGKEMWKAIEGYPNYEVSNQGRVKNVRRGKVVKSSPNVWGYLGLSLYNDGNCKRHTIHRLVAEAFIKNDEGKKEVNHIDGDKLNNCSDNLEWVTRSENMTHAHENGLADMSKAYKKSPKTRGKEIYVYDKQTEKEANFKNGAIASRNFGFTESYFSKIINFNNGENERFKVRYL